MKPRLLDLFERTETVGACRLWQGWKNDDGYGYVRCDGRDQPVHRVVYALSVGPIPDGHEVDHRCRQRACIEPSHLEAVTHAENQRRMGLAQQACRARGHDWGDPTNVYVRNDGRRWCAACARERWHV